ncbi:MAG: hypothetical protein LBF44_01475 [Holosporaceae bacterium]|jgi:hypothetical protein|nr:hypothetical protein [Holosporaceae bacterium]
MVVMLSVFYILLFIFGNAFCTVLHFVIEDFFRIEPEFAIFFGKEYNKCFSTIVILTIILLILFCLRARMVRKMSVEKYEAKSTLPLLNCQLCDVVLGIALLSASIYCIKILHLYLAFLFNLVVFLRIGAILFCLSLLIIYLILEKKHIRAPNKKLHYSIIGGMMLVCGLITTFAVFKYANPTVLARIVEDCRTLRAVSDLGNQWTRKQYKSLDELFSSLDQSQRDTLKMNNISCEIKNNSSIIVKFNLISLPEDIYKVRADQRLNWRYNYDLLMKNNSYKTGQNIKIFTNNKKNKNT